MPLFSKSVHGSIQSQKPSLALNHDSKLLLLTRVFLLLLLLLQIPSAMSFDLNAEMDDCARVQRIPRLTDKRHGFDFGFGSLNDTEFMCRTKYHIRIIQCVKDRWENLSDVSTEPDFLKVVWAHTLNTQRYERAATYICQQHNLRIFHQHKNSCLRASEPGAESCSHQTDEAIREVVDALKNHSNVNALGILGDSYQQGLKKIMLVYECKAMRKKLDCLFSLLTSRCPADAVQLIMNYFIESLPTGCYYAYQSTDKAEGDSTPTNPSVMQGDDGTSNNLGQPISMSHYSRYDNSPPNVASRDLPHLMLTLLSCWLLVQTV